MPKANHHGGNPDPEVLDTTPVEMPLGSIQPTPLNELIAMFVRQEVEMQTKNEFDSFEDEDYEDENPELLNLTPYELTALEDEQPVIQEESPAAKPEEESPSNESTEEPSETSTEA